MIIINPGDSLNEIINNSPDNETIIINEGTYNEKVRITKSNITIRGNGNVVIQNKDWYSKIHIDNKEYNTFRTYTMMILGDNIKINNVTIKNLSTPSRNYGQAVALHVLGTNFSMTNSKLYSAQDTLFLAPLPENLQTKYIGFLYPEELSPRYNKMVFKDCYIEGDVDFIFGAADAVFLNCHFHSVGKTGYYFAPSHLKDFEYGFTVINSKFTGEYENSTIIARPCRDYGKLTIINSSFQENIVPCVGFNKWEGTNRDKTARFEYYNISIDDSSFVPWAKKLNEAEAKKYLEHANALKKEVD